MVNVEDYMNLVHAIVNKRYKQFKHKYEYEDLFQIGCLGLTTATKRFDKSKDVKFITYAYMWIDGYLLKHIRDDKWYLGRNKTERFTGPAPISLDMVINLNADKPTSCLEQLVDRSNEYKLLELRMLVEELPSLPRRVIKLKYFNDMTAKQISEILGIGESTIYKYQREALKILREELLA